MKERWKALYSLVFLNQSWQNFFVLLDHPLFLSYVTILLMRWKNAKKNAYEKIAILCKCADGYAATSLTFYSSVCVLFFFLGFLSRTFTFHRTAGKGEGYLFNSSVLLPPASRTRTGNLWFPSASVSFHLYVVETVQN